MKSQLSFVATGVLLGVAALGFAAVRFLPASNPQSSSPQVHMAEAASPNRIYCYSGMKGVQGRLYRGWVCEVEQAPTMPN
jgi:hypothetical protein